MAGKKLLLSNIDATKLTTDRHEASRGLFATAELLVIASKHTDARYCYSYSVRPSVRLSVRHVPVFCGNGLTYCHSFYTTR